MDTWVERELGDEFPDRRLKARLGKLLGDLGRRIGGTVPAACQDWAATKAAYRFFSNRRGDEDILLAGHFAATAARYAATAGTRARSWCCTTRPSSASPGTRPRRSG